MDQQQLISEISTSLKVEELRALFLVGSFGRGTADTWSDVDFLALVTNGQERVVADLWRAALEAIIPIVFWQKLPRGLLVLNAISEEWLRCDVTIATQESIGQRAKNTVRVLIDRDGIYDRLPDELPPREPDRETVRYLIHEFIRMLGLLPVCAGRGEYVTMVRGVGMMRGHLETLLMQDVSEPDPGGMLHQSKLLSPEQMELLRSLPYPQPEKDAVIEANFAMARAFMPRARAMAQRLGIAWPDAFEAATRRHLAATLGEHAGRVW
jgi:predicted nucleotidyltransferase